MAIAVAPIPTLLVAFDILNTIESHKVISQLQQIAKLHETTVRINLKTTGGNIPSLLKPPEIHDTDISQALAISSDIVFIKNLFQLLKDGKVFVSH